MIYQTKDALKARIETMQEGERISILERFKSPALTWMGLFKRVARFATSERKDPDSGDRIASLWCMEIRPYVVGQGFKTPSKCKPPYETTPYEQNRWESLMRVADQQAEQIERSLKFELGELP